MKHCKFQAYLIFTLIMSSVFLSSCVKCSSSWSSSKLQYSKDYYTADMDELLANLQVLTSSPHPFGSKRQQEVASYLVEKARANSDLVYEQTFEVEVPNRRVNLSNVGPMPTKLIFKGRNIYAKAKLKTKEKCAILVGSHYDTKIIDRLKYVGANDSGSSSVLLLDMLRNFASSDIDEKLNLQCDIYFVWFDGEESILDGWTDGEEEHPAKIKDNTYGSRYAVNELVKCKKKFDVTKCLPDYLQGQPLIALVLLDLVGSKNVKITQDINSSSGLIAILKTILKDLELAHILSNQRTYIEDDHIPFRSAGIQAIDIIDFENLDYWHKEGDEISNISFESIEIIGKIAANLILKIASNPKVSN